MKLVVEVHLGNEEMQTIAQAKNAIGNALLAQAVDPLHEGQIGSIRDVNGNTVGRWEVVAS